MTDVTAGSKCEMIILHLNHTKVSFKGSRWNVAAWTAAVDINCSKVNCEVSPTVLTAMKLRDLTDIPAKDEAGKRFKGLYG